MLVPEDSDGAGEVWTHTRGLRPRISATQIQRLQHDPTSTTVTIRTRDGTPISIDGRVAWRRADELVPIQPRHRRRLRHPPPRSDPALPL